MNLLRQSNRLRFWVASVLIIMLMTACGANNNTNSLFTESNPSPATTPDIAYGTTLDEWGADKQSDEKPTPSNDDDDEQPDFVTGIPVTFNNVVYQEIMWEGLVPLDYTADSIMTRYEEELASILDGSPEATELYATMQEEFNNAPVNEMLNDTMVRIPGFITPLEYEGDLITEFLLVPYFGACIHVPAPPANQTVLVQTAEGQGIPQGNAFYPIWVMGRLSTEGATTQLAAAGYYIQDGSFEVYTYPD